MGLVLLTSVSVPMSDWEKSLVSPRYMSYPPNQYAATEDMKALRNLHQSHHRKVIRRPNPWPGFRRLRKHTIRQPNRYRQHNTDSDTCNKDLGAWMFYYKLGLLFPFLQFHCARFRRINGRRLEIIWKQIQRWLNSQKIKGDFIPHSEKSRNPWREDSAWDSS